MKFQTGTQYEKELGRIAKHSRVVIQRNHQLIHGYFAARRATLANVHQPQSADQPNLQQLQVPNLPRHKIYIRTVNS